jgi:hypothetical protein
MAANALDDLVASLRADGALDSEGHFTLDREQARSKMQKFQLADARRYVLELVQAAVLRGAEAIEFEIDTDDMHMRFGGQPFTEAELDDLYGSLFRPGDARALRGVRQLALALNAALGMEPKHIHLRSGNVELRMHPGRRDELIPHDAAQAISGPRPRPEPGPSRAEAMTTIHVRQRVRARMVLDFFANLTGRLAEEQYLRERCVYAGVPIQLDGKLISRGLSVDEESGGQLRLLGRKFAGSVRVVLDDAPAVLHLVKDGVWIDSHQLPECGTNLVAVVEGERLRKDVSQARIVADDSVAAIVAAVRRVRWQLWRQMQAMIVELGGAREATHLAERLRVQLLQHVELSELRDDENALALAEHITWKDCRGAHPEVSLRRMVELVIAGQTPHFASRGFPDVPVEGAPILWLKKKDAALLAKPLGHTPVQANTLLMREELRAQGHKAWLAREGEPALPTHVQFEYRATIAATGQVGIDHHALFGHLQHPVQVLLFKQRRLLGRLELDVNIPNVWLVLEAEFSATDDYRDAVRDGLFVRALLTGFAALLEPLGRLLADHPDNSRSANIRGLAKRWLIALIDPPSQAALLGKANVVDASKSYTPLAELLPGLTIERLLGTEPPLLAQQPLFAQVQGPHRSLVQLAVDLRTHGHVRYLASPPNHPDFEAPGVVILGPGDRKLVRGLFGADSCQELDTGPQERRIRFLAQPLVNVTELRGQFERELSVMGVQASRWIVELGGSTRGVVLPAYADPGPRFEDLRPELLARTTVRVLFEQRLLCELTLELGLGPLIAIVEADALRPDVQWQDVERDDAWRTVLADLRTAVEQLVVSLCGVFEQEVPSVQRWLARVLLHHAARRADDDDRTAFARMAQLPMLDTVSGRVLTLAQAEQVRTKWGKLEVVSRETSWAPMSDPEVIKAEPDERDDLSVLFGGEVQDGSERVRYRHVSEKLAMRPRMTEAKFSPEQVLAQTNIQADARHGVVGISRTRSEPSLHLRIGVAGHHVHDAVEDGDLYSLPLDAIVIDDQLGLDADGKPELRSKRYQQLLRQVRGRIPDLVSELCRSWERDEQLRASIWPLVLGYLRRDISDERRKAREQAFEAASQIPGFVDLWGKNYSLHDIMEASPNEVVRALTDHRARELPEQLAGELILQLGPAELACLSAHLEVAVLDDQWQAELDRLRWLAAAQLVERPNIDDVALAYRKATVGGGLECELWLPRDHSPLGSDPHPQVEFVRDGRRIARAALLELCPCAGIVSGAGLVTHGSEVVLDKRQRISLLRQLLILYVDLAHALGKRRLPGKDQERALAYLAWVEHRFEIESAELAEVFSVGKHGAELRSLVGKLVPPTLRDTLSRRVVAGKPTAPERPPEREPDVTPAPVVAMREVAPEPRTSLSPSQRLLVAVSEQLRWARARHGNLLDELRLAHLELQAGDAAAIVRIQPAGIVLDSSHPLIRRLLGQDPHDRFDLAFAVAAVYTQMNHFAEQITDDDEREFVAQLAETLALSLHADPSRAAGSRIGC